MIEVLLSVFLVLQNGQPARHAQIQCDEIRRHTDEYGSEDDDLDTDGLGAVLTTDSRGHMIYNGPPDIALLHCRAWLGRATWKGTIEFTTHAVTLELR